MDRKMNINNSKNNQSGMNRFYINQLDARSRYTDFAQTSLRRQNAVYRRHGMLPHTPEVSIPATRCITASRRKTVYSICFLMHTGPSIPES